MSTLRLSSLLLALCLVLPSLAHAVPQQLSQQGRLFDSEGTAVSGSHVLTFKLYDAATDGGVVRRAAGLHIRIAHSYTYMYL